MNVNMLKSYYRINLWTLYAIREDPGDKEELMCWEGRGEQRFNPEEVNLGHSLTIPQKGGSSQDFAEIQKHFYQYAWENKGCSPPN